ncbi:MAG: hypothetical protein IJB49_00895 [Clostridia bacterium]|nr:hypothetical protein [Clostridia bacterium]
MTEQVKQDMNESKDRFFSLKLLLTVVLAFAAAFVFRRSVGVISMTGLAFLLCGAAAFIKISPLLKTAVFALSVFALNTIEQSDIKVTLIYSALCLLACVAFEYAASKICLGKKLGYAVAAIGLAACILLSFMFVGNPIKAFKAQRVFNEYIEAVYPETEDAALGSFKFTKVYYNYTTKAYTSDGVSSRYPTEPASLSLSGDIIKDSFAPIMEAKIAEPYSLEMTMLLRKSFPDDSFGVEYDSIASMPGATLFSAAEGELSNDMNYIITLGGIQGAKEMLERTEEYLNVIDRSGIGYGRIIFRSGIGNWYRRSITIEGDHFIGHPVFKLDKVRIGCSTELNTFVFETLRIN